MKKVIAALVGATSCLAITYYSYQHFTQSKNDATIEHIIKNGFNEGNVFFKESDYQQALDCYQEVLSVLPKHIPSYVNSAYCYQKLGKINNAIDAFAKVIEINPADTETHMQLGKLYASQETDESDAHAINHFSKVVLLEPHNEEAFFNLGETLVMNGNSERAIEEYKKLIALNPQSSNAHVAIGKAYERMNQMETARTYYQKAIELTPNNHFAHISLAGAHWALGNYGDGFQEYEWRWYGSNMKNMQRWDGSDPKGKTIVLLGEAGLGDTIQFIRFAKTVKEQGATVYMAVQKPLIPLLSENDYIDKVFLAGSQIAGFDTFTSVQSIPALMHTTMETLPNEPYMKANDNLVTYWHDKLKNDTNFKIGICWQAAGCKGHVPQGRRSINIKEFAPLADIKNISFYSLQKGNDALDQLADLPSHFKLINFEKLDTEHGPFMDTAALMKNLDLIITIDTSIAHLAGALGVPTITLLPFHPDPRWMYDRPDTPWYPSMTLVRQSKPGDWQSAIKESAHLVKEKVSTDKA